MVLFREGYRILFAQKLHALIAHVHEHAHKAIIFEKKKLKGCHSLSLPKEKLVRFMKVLCVYVSVVPACIVMTCTSMFTCARIRL